MKKEVKVFRTPHTLLVCWTLAAFSCDFHMPICWVVEGWSGENIGPRDWERGPSELPVTCVCWARRLGGVAACYLRGHTLPNVCCLLCGLFGRDGKEHTILISMWNLGRIVHCSVSVTPTGRLKYFERHPILRAVGVSAQLSNDEFSLGIQQYITYSLSSLQRMPL